MKDMLKDLSTLISLVGLLMASLVGITVGGVTGVIYVLAHIIRYWVLRGLRKVITLVGFGDYMRQWWNKLIWSVSKNDAHDMRRVMDLTFDD